MLELSVVIPVFNERGNVAILHKEIFSVLNVLGKPFEIIFINDGSTDGTLDVLKKIKPVKVINFRKNFGQTAALDAGFKAAKGKVVIAMDGDLQNDPNDIPLILNKLNDGYDVVSGWRKNRKDKFLKNFTSRGANFLRHRLVNDYINDSGCTLKAYRRQCLQNLDLYGEMHRFIPALLVIRGFKIGEVIVNHRPRLYGKTKYSLSRVTKGFLDMLAIWFWQKYSTRPLHFFGGIGLFIFSLGILLIFSLFILRLFNFVTLSRSVWPLGGFFMVLVGIYFITIGFLADVILKIYHKGGSNFSYEVKEFIENN